MFVHCYAFLSICWSTKIASVVPLPGTKPDWESPIDTRPLTVLCKIFMVVHLCFTLNSCLCPEHHPWGLDSCLRPEHHLYHPSICNSGQWNFAHSQLSLCHLYTFGQVSGVNWDLIWGSISLNMSLTSWCCRATTSDNHHISNKPARALMK